MNYLSNKTMTKNTVNALVMSLVFSSASFSMQAMRVSNGIEMGLAAATTVPDMLAHHYDYTDNKKTAAFLHLTTDTLSILNKLVFFANANRAGASVSDQDSLGNGFWLARDITRFVQHAKAYRTAQNFVAPERVEDNQSVVDNDDLFLSLNQSLDTELKPEEISRLAYTCQVYVLPMLRGASACALAWSQGRGAIDQFNGREARFLATALHSLIRLSEEYAELEEGSSYKKVLAVALIANAAWLVKEIRDYDSALEAYKAAQAAEAERLRELRGAQDAFQIRRGEVGQGGGAQDPELLRIMQQIRQLRGEDALVPVPGDLNQALFEEFDQLIELDAEQVAFRQALQREPVANLQLVRRGACTICLDGESDDRRQLACGHAFCLECLGEYVGNEIHEMHGQMGCPDRNCQRQMRDGEIRAIIQGNNLQVNNVNAIHRYDQFLQRGQHAARICPTDGCAHVFGNPNNRRCSEYHCPECNAQYCANCMVPHARNISCMRARIEAVPGTREWLDESENRSLCPDCFTRIERMNMCPNMNCGEERCRRAFCLYCHNNGGHAPGCPNRWHHDTPDGRRGQ